MAENVSGNKVTHRETSVWRDIWALPRRSCTSMVRWGAKCAAVKPCLGKARTSAHTDAQHRREQSLCDAGGQRQGRLFSRNIKHDYSEPLWEGLSLSPGPRRITGQGDYLLFLGAGSTKWFMQHCSKPRGPQLKLAARAAVWGGSNRIFTFSSDVAVSALQDLPQNDESSWSRTNQKTYQKTQDQKIDLALVKACPWWWKLGCILQEIRKVNKQKLSFVT